MTKVILDLCGGTGAWSKPYDDAGYLVYNITLPTFNVMETKVDGDIIFFNNFGDTCKVSEVYGILAAPPCTEFSLAKRNLVRDFDAGMKIVKACLEIVWKCRTFGKLKWWAMENPRGFLRQFLGKPAFTFEQWEFGDKGIKPTDLWGYFNEPKKVIKDRTKRVSKKYPNGRFNAEGWSTSARNRAITPAGFANAFFKANP